MEVRGQVKSFQKKIRNQKKKNGNFRIFYRQMFIIVFPIFWERWQFVGCYVIITEIPIFTFQNFATVTHHNILKLKRKL